MRSPGDAEAGHADIRLDGVTKVFPGAAEPAVQDLSLEVASGHVVTLVGPSGSGKTTTLRMINRLVEPTAGTITVAGRDVRSLAAHELRLGIGYVIQETGLFPHRTVEQNVATVPRLLGWSRTRVRRRVEELVDLVGLERDLLARYPGELSGGQQQRVGVARALAADPPVLLMDEPFGSVDPIVRARLQDELLALQARLHKTIVFVTHDIDEAIKLGDRVAIFETGGVVAQAGPPAEVLRAPASPFVEEFLGRERALKRLSLVTVANLPVEAGPVVAPTATAAEARAVMADHGVAWVGVADGGRLLGWVPGEALREGTALGDHALRPFRATVAPWSSLREALDAAVSSDLHAVPVVDGEKFQGIVTLDAISAEVQG